MDKIIWIYLGMVAFLTGCANDLLQEQTLATSSFHVSTRAGDNTAEQPISKQQLVRLYVAERKPETGQLVESTDPYWDQYNVVLFCDKYYDLTGNTYHVEHQLGVWHKFAFVCVPNMTPTMGELLFPNDHFFMKYKDLYDFRINFQPVLHYQSVLNERGEGDLSVYRKVIDRWLDEDMATYEDVVLKRITGQLVLNMGKPADQFDTKEKGNVTHFTIEMDTPQNCYIRDEVCDSVIVKDLASTSFTWNVDERKQLTEQIIRIDLLPGQLANAKVTVHFKVGTSESFALKGRSANGLEHDDVEIKKNTRTVVLFNGIGLKDFEVRYAGFADGNDAMVDVDDDAWDGI